MVKPAYIFDRDWEWQALTEFATGTQPEVAFGVVSGRRRQGKTFLLRALAEELGGFYFEATEGTDIELLRLFGMTLGQHTGSPVGLPFADWRDALTFMFSLPGERPMPLIIDEFPYLMKANPALPSILKQEIDLRGRTHRGTSQARLLICGSALSVMGKVLSGQAPLRGRARLELVVQPLPFRAAGEFWELEDPRLAAMVHAIAGGTPAYRHEFVASDTPRSLEDFDAWVVRSVLDRRRPSSARAGTSSPRRPTSRPGPLPLGAGRHRGRQPHLGAHRRAHRLQVLRHTHPLRVLEDCGLVVKERDAFQSNATCYRIAEPIIAFYQAIMRPEWAALTTGHAAQVWERARGASPPPSWVRTSRHSAGSTPPVTATTCSGPSARSPRAP